MSSEELFDEFEKLREQRWNDTTLKGTGINELLADLANGVTLLYIFLNEKHEKKQEGFKDF